MRNRCLVISTGRANPRNPLTAKTPRAKARRPTAIGLLVCKRIRQDFRVFCVTRVTLLEIAEAGCLPGAGDSLRLPRDVGDALLSLCSSGGRRGLCRPARAESQR